LETPPIREPEPLLAPAREFRSPVEPRLGRREWKLLIRIFQTKPKQSDTLQVEL
jgi:hypothetical protein